MMIAFVRSLLFYTAFYLGSVVYALAPMIARLFGTAAFRRAVRGWSLYHRWCARVFLGIRIRIEGDVPQGQVLVALRHESFFEAIDLPALLDTPGVFAKAELARVPLWGKIGVDYGVVSVARDQGAKALRTMLGDARALAAEGRVLAIFPEGTRVPHGQTRPLQAGFAGLYKLLGMPVVPIAVNSGPLYQRRWKRAGVMTYRIGAPIPPGLPRAEIEERVLAAINALNAGGMDSR